MPSQNIAQQAQRGQEHFHRTHQQMITRQQEGFRRTARRWHVEAERRMQEHQRPQAAFRGTNPRRGASPAHSVGLILWVVILVIVVLVGATMLLGYLISESSLSTQPDPSIGTQDSGAVQTIGWIRTASNVRAGPGTSYRILGQLPAGTRVVIDCR